MEVEDRRGTPGGKVMVTGGLGMILVAVIAMLFGVDPAKLLDTTGQQHPAPSSTSSTTDPNDEVGAFVKTLLADTEDVWTDVFKRYDKRYQPCRLVLYSGSTRMPGGVADSATGPFYYPADQTVYLDTSFFAEMKNRFRAGGDFAYAYVLAHEIGHHVQHLLGFTNRVHGQQGRVSESEYNRLSVRLELQADFLAGVWAHHAQERWKILEPGDVEEAMTAAQAIGDDRLQKQSQGYVVPDGFTHGTSEQRMRWFMKGLKTGKLEEGDTFSIPYGQL
jgi:hypothetical protein